MDRPRIVQRGRNAELIYQIREYSQLHRQLGNYQNPIRQTCLTSRKGWDEKRQNAFGIIF